MHLELFDGVGGDEEPNANRDEEDADDEEGRQHVPGCKDRLPGWKPLLFKSGIIRFLVLLGTRPTCSGGSGAVTVLFFRVVTGRHHGCSIKVPC